ncbi:F-box-like domain-containing protein [Legionella bozemanae]|uniref:F-box-like domain-containing protein n=1 Tax=Legionella bozemanae TaxID=447 RepID=UPI003EE8419B
MNSRITYFQEQINLIHAVYLLLEQSYDYLSGFSPQGSDGSNGVGQLLKIKQALEVHTELVNNLQGMLTELKQKKDNKSAFNSLSAEIGMRVEKLLIDIIDLSCPVSSQTVLKKQYSMLLTKTFCSLQSQEKSLLTQFTTTLTGSLALKQFKVGLKKYITELTIAIRQKQKVIERELPQEMQNELITIRAGSFSKLPREVTACITSFLKPTDLCRLSETGQFFRKITEIPRANWKTSFEKSVTPIIVNLIGDTDIGIKSLICRLAENKFIDSNWTQIQRSHVRNDKKYGSLLLRYESPLVQGRDYPMTHNAAPYYRKQYMGDKIHLLCFDISSRVSFNHLKFWYNDVFRYNEYNPRFRLLFVGLKGDVDSARLVSKQEANELAASFYTVYIETSAKEAIGLDKLKSQIIETYMESHKPMYLKQKEESHYSARP